MSYLGRLAARTADVESCLCLGIDPHPDQLPEGFSRDVQGIEYFSRLLLDAAVPYAAAVKVNLAFFEAWGSAGIAALERLRGAVPREVPFILDAKRGDIPSTAERQSVALFESIGADAVTASPYLGRDAIEPLLTRGFVYVLCRTSNPGAADFQSLPVNGEPLYLHVARTMSDWAFERTGLGLVVGATAMDELRQAREAASGLPFLVPGVGTQGGNAAEVLAAGRATAHPAGSRRGGGLLVNVSRAIAVAAVPGTRRETGAAIAAAAAAWSDQLRC